MNKPWLKQYPDGIPAEIEPEDYTSIGDFFERTVEKYSDRPAVANMGQTLTYAGLEQKSRHLAAFLTQELRLAPGSRVGVMMPNLLQNPISILGILRAGLVVVNINPLYTPRELEHQLADSGAECIIVLENFCSVVAAVTPPIRLRAVIVTRIGDQLRFPKSAIANFVVRHIKKMVPAYKLDNVFGFNQALKSGARHTFRPAPCKPEDTAFLQYTGGTTGICKSAVLSHANLLVNMQQATAWITHGSRKGKQIEHGREIVIAALPLYHIFSLTASFLTFMNLGGLNYLITNPRDLKQFVRELKSVPFTCLPGVNTLFNHLLNTPGFTDIDFSTLKISLGGGMPVLKSTAEEWKKVTGSPIIEAYGLTETSPAVCINPLDQEDFSGSIGLPISSTDCSIRDEDGRELPAGETGELCVRGPQVMKEYWQKPDETRNVFHAGGWLRTGDIARIDCSGYIYLVDRMKDVILVSGFNVFPNDIEAVISTHPDVLECGVIGVTCEATGESVKAYVVRRNPALNDSDLIEFCRDKLTAYKIPKAVEFVDDLPKSNVGKVLRRELRTLHSA